jgi:peptide/nickel transport system ATP-binding protein
MNPQNIRAGAVDQPLLSVQELEVTYRTRRGDVRAVNKVSFDIGHNEVFGLAGESGCGKSTVAFAVARLHKPPAEIVGGRVMFEGRDLLTMKPDELQKFRWRDMAIVTQSAMNALNPVITVGAQIMDALMAHEPIDKKEARRRTQELLEMVGIDPKRVDSYPHQLSGGMRQRAVIAMAMALNPQLIIMDEPTTALDVVVQKQILEEIKRLKDIFKFSILFITHDLSLLVEFTDRIGIMYAGELVEVAPSYQLFKSPQHPYTEKLMGAFPTIFGERRLAEGIAGAPPNLITPPSGCKFHPRCHRVIDGVCAQHVPALTHISPNQQVSCFLVNPVPTE